MRIKEQKTHLTLNEHDDDDDDDDLIQETAVVCPYWEFIAEEDL